MADLSSQYNFDLAQHLNQVITRLSKSAEGNNKAALSYRAFELCHAVEHLAVYCWEQVNTSRIKKHVKPYTS